MDGADDPNKLNKWRAQLYKDGVIGFATYLSMDNSS